MIAGITEKEQKIIERILDKYRKDYAFFYYGSRVKGTYEKTSDLDVLIKGKAEMPLAVLQEIKEEFDNSDLPYIVNFSDYYKLDGSFYKRIKSDLIPYNWQEVKLGDDKVSTLIGDGLHGTPAYTKDGDYAFINGNNLLSGYVIIKPDTKLVSKSEYLKYKKNLTSKTLFVSINGTLGNIAEYNNEKIILGKSVCYLNITSNVEKRFIKYVLLSPVFQNYLHYNATGTTIKNVSLKRIREYSFILPPLEVQKKIAGVLGALDDKIELNNKINQNLEAQAQALFKSWFIDFEPFGGKMPNDWKECCLGDICECLLGGTPNRNIPEYWNGDIPWINSGEVNNFRIVKPSEYISKLGLSKSATKLLPEKTTVIAITGATLGQVSLLEIKACANQSVVGILQNSDMPYEFIFPFIKYNILDLISHQTGGAQQHINKQNVEHMHVLKPAKDVLLKYKKTLEPLYKMIAKNCFENIHFAELRDTLLPKLMSGEINVDNVKID